MFGDEVESIEAKATFELGDLYSGYLVDYVLNIFLCHF